MPVKKCCPKEYSLNVIKQPLYEYRDIWAEESARLGNNSSEWSFGNGATGSIGIPLEGEWYLNQMYFSADVFPVNGSVIVDFVRYNTNTSTTNLVNIELTSPTDGGGSLNNAFKVIEFNPMVLVANQPGLYGFRTRTVSGIISDARVGVRLSKQVGEYVSDVELV